MLDSISIANLQMLMNTGDGRQAVLSELIFPDRDKLQSRSTSRKQSAPYAESKSGKVHCGQGQFIRLLQPTRNAIETATTLTENIVAVLDELPRHRKASLIAFAENLSYHYNNLFMGLIGHISIVMHHITPIHPAYAKLRECEELVLNTAMLIRLLVDVFRRNEEMKKTLYPIDLSDKEIGQKIFPPDGGGATLGHCIDTEQQVHRIQLFVSDRMASALEDTLAELSKIVREAFAYPGLKSTFTDHYLRSMLCIKKGSRLANSLLEYAGRICLKRSKIDLSLLVKETLEIHHSCRAAVKTNLEVSGIPMTVLADRSFLRKALLKLIDQACRKGSACGTLNITLMPARIKGFKTDAGRRPRFHRVTISPFGGKDFKPGCVKPLNPFDSPDRASRKHNIALAAATGIIRKHGGKLFTQKIPGSCAYSILLPASHTDPIRPHHN